MNSNFQRKITFYATQTKLNDTIFEIFNAVSNSRLPLLLRTRNRTFHSRFLLATVSANKCKTVRKINERLMIKRIKEFSKRTLRSLIKTLWRNRKVRRRFENYVLLMHMSITKYVKLWFECQINFLSLCMSIEILTLKWNQIFKK